MWKLPASIALQIYYYRLQTKGMIFVTGENNDQLLKRLQRVNTR